MEIAVITVIGIWLLILTFRKSDKSKEINDLSKAINKNRLLIQDTKERIEENENDIYDLEKYSIVGKKNSKGLYALYTPDETVELISFDIKSTKLEKK